MLRTFLYIILALVGILLIIGAVRWFKSRIKDAWDKIHFNFRRESISLSLDNLTQLLLTGNTQTRANVGLTVKNDNDFSIPISNVYAEFFYQGVKIAQTIPGSKKLNVKIVSKDEVGNTGRAGITDMTDEVLVFINQTTLRFFAEYFSKENPKLSYKISAKIFGIPREFEGDFQTE